MVAVWCELASELLPGVSMYLIASSCVGEYPCLLNKDGFSPVAGKVTGPASAATQLSNPSPACHLLQLLACTHCCTCATAPPTLLVVPWKLFGATTTLAPLLWLCTSPTCTSSQ